MLKDVDAFLSDSESSELSEEFKEKRVTVFEALEIEIKSEEEVTRLEEEYTNELTSEINETKADPIEKVDNYLNYVVEEWMKEEYIGS